MIARIAALPPLVLALAAVLLWSTLAAMSLKLRGMPPFLLVGITLVIGSISSVHRIRDWRASWKVIALGVYGLFAYHFTLFVALRNAPAVEANLINYLWPLLIVVLAPLFVRGSHLTLRHVAGALLGFAGAALLVTGGKFAFEWQYATGYALAAGAALIWSTFSLATSRLGSVPTAMVGLFCAVSGALALMCHAVFEPRYAFAASDWPWLIALGLGPMGLAFFAWDAALKRGDPRSIGMLSYLTPLLSTLVLALTGGGALTTLALVAMGMIIGGALLGTWPRTDETYVIRWEFQVAPEHEQAFVQAYGEQGDWVQLFKRGDGYLGTSLSPVTNRPGWYRTVDRWSSRARYDAFRGTFAQEYAAIDRACEALTLEERRV
jgi:drug/metabolite transporter (DMT)-like permease